MSLDTRSKRASSIGIMLVSMLAPPLPDGTLDQGDTQHIAWSYSGILAEAITTVIDGRIIYLRGSVEASIYLKGSVNKDISLRGSVQPTIYLRGSL